MTPATLEPDARARDGLLLEQREANENLVVASLRAMAAAETALRSQRRAEAEATALKVRADERARLIIEERMASLGALTAGAAHEISNPLAILMRNLELATEKIRETAGKVPSPKLLELLTELLCDAYASADRVEKVVHGLRTFSKGDESPRHAVMLPKALNFAINLASNEIFRRARIVQAFGPSPLVDADEALLAQLFVHLLVNAAQSLPEERPEQNEIRAAISTDEKGRAVVTIEDNGPGISDANLGRIFEPFFTTKPVGVGTGLGLSICQGIVMSLGGDIVVESKVGHGSVFKVVLPPSRVLPSSSDDASSSAVPHPRRGRVLVIDDDVLLGALLRRMLEHEHDVATFTGALEALGHLSEGARYDVILCNLTMPGIDGVHFYGILLSFSREQAEKVIFMTDPASPTTRRELLEVVPNERIEKPVDMRALRATVRRMVSGGERPVPWWSVATIT